EQINERCRPKKAVTRSGTGISPATCLKTSAGGRCHAQSALQTPPDPGEPGKRTERAEPVGGAPANNPAIQRRDQRHKHGQWDCRRDALVAFCCLFEKTRRGAASTPAQEVMRQQKSTHRQHEKMSDRKGSGLLRKRQRKLPDQDDSCVYENRERSVFEFAGQIATHP